MELREELTEFIGEALAALARDTRDQAEQNIVELADKIEMLEASAPHRGEMVELAGDALQLLRAGQQADSAVKLWLLWKLARKK